MRLGGYEVGFPCAKGKSMTLEKHWTSSCLVSVEVSLIGARKKCLVGVGHGKESGLHTIACCVQHCGRFANEIDTVLFWKQMASFCSFQSLPASSQWKFIRCHQRCWEGSIVEWWWMMFGETQRDSQRARCTEMFMYHRMWLFGCFINERFVGLSSLFITMSQWRKGRLSSGVLLSLHYHHQGFSKGTNLPDLQDTMGLHFASDLQRGFEWTFVAALSPHESYVQMLQGGHPYITECAQYATRS